MLSGRMITFILVILESLLCGVLYLFIAYKLKVLEKIFGKDFSWRNIIKRVKH